MAKTRTTSLSEVIGPGTTEARELAALDTAMQSLALDERHPIALEIAGTSTTRQFLLRATTASALKHLQDQIYARYPQAEITAVGEDQDPLRCRHGEAVSACELEAGAPAYLPLHRWRGKDVEPEGADPLLGILAVFNHLPEGMRVVTQLALIPAPPAWSAPYRRKAVEHPLEQERMQQRRELAQRGSNPSTLSLILLALLVILAVLWWRFQSALDRILPTWLIQAVADLLHGKAPHLSPPEQQLLIIGAVCLLAVIFGGAWLVMQIASRFRSPLYTIRQVEERTEKPAYRVRLRLFVFAKTAIPPHRRTWRQQWQHVARRSQQLGHASRRRYYVRLARCWWRAQRRKAGERQEREELLSHIATAYRQYDTASAGYFVVRRQSAANIQRILVDVAAGLHRSRHLMTPDEIWSMWHLLQPRDARAVPFLKRTRARTFLAPAALTRGPGWIIGSSSHTGHTVPVYLPWECLLHNMLVVASTGMGKSTLFQHLIQAASRCGQPTFSLEPHTATEKAAGLLDPAMPAIIADMAKTSAPIGINPLDMVGKNRDKVADNLIVIAEHLWAGGYGLRTENILEYALKTLADANDTLIHTDPEHGPDRQYTLLDVVALLRKTSFRDSVLEQVSDAFLIDWWETYYEPMDGHLQLEVTSSVITKLSKFASSRVTRRILGQPRSTIDLAAIIREGATLLVNTASGVVGADVSELIGIILLGLFQSALAEQASLPPADRKRYLVLIDEFQVYRGANYQMMLAELRKYGGSFALATQSLAYLDRLDKTLRATVLANIDHLFAFRTSEEDARHLRVLDGVEATDITNLDDFHCYVKLSVSGQRLPTFSMRLASPPSPKSDLAAFLYRESQSRDGRPVGVVDQQLKDAQTRRRYAAPQKKRRKAPSKAGHPDTAPGSPPDRNQPAPASAKNTHRHLMYPDEEPPA